MAALTARMFLEVGAVHFRPEEPFRFTSGLASPVYVDCRKLIAYPRIRQTITEFAVTSILREVGFESLDSVAGGETAGIPFAAWIADRLALPMQYVRKQPKGFGRNARIEGDYTEGGRTILVEDLSTDGGTKLRFCQALRDAGLKVADVFVVFDYDVFPETNDVLAEYGIVMHRLVSWRDVLDEARGTQAYDPKTIEAIEAFLNEPLAWSERHGGVASLEKS